jgi:hypothetical protein
MVVDDERKKKVEGERRPKWYGPKWVELGREGDGPPTRGRERPGVEGEPRKEVRVFFSKCFVFLSSSKTIDYKTGLKHFQTSKQRNILF